MIRVDEIVGGGCFLDECEEKNEKIFPFEEIIACRHN